MNFHAKRWITAAVALPVILCVIILGTKLLFALFIAALALLGLGEYNAMVFSEGMVKEKSETLVAGFLVMAAAFVGGLELVIALSTFVVIGVFILFLLKIRTCPANIDAPVKVIFGVFYVALMMSYFILVREDEKGREWIFFLVIIAFTSDVFAFYAGRTWGRRKLIPSVSAGKTVEGSLGGIAGAVIVCVVFSFLFLPQVPWMHAAMIGFLGSIFGQLGDLCESAIKRASGRKDSGTFFPGHGGVLDRLDSLLFIAPFVYYYKLFVLP